MPRKIPITKLVLTSAELSKGFLPPAPVPPYYNSLEVEMITSALCYRWVKAPGILTPTIREVGDSSILRWEKQFSHTLKLGKTQPTASGVSMPKTEIPGSVGRHHKKEISSPPPPSLE